MAIDNIGQHGLLWCHTVTVTTVTMPGRTRKQRFKKALKVRGLSMRQWAKLPGAPATRYHISECFAGRRVMGADLKAKLDEFIKSAGA